MNATDHARAIRRIVNTLEIIVQQWPEISAADLLKCARALPAIIADRPARALLISRAAALDVDDLVDQRLLPPWCGQPTDEEEARLRAL